ncbi:MAG: cupin domain-containing protein [Chitinophagaceae bacterium]
MKKNQSSRRFFMKTSAFATAASLLPASILKAETITNSEDLKPVLIKPGEGEQFSNPSSSFTQKITAADTGGGFSCTETIVNDGWLVGPPHLHHNLDEIMYVLEGTITLLIGEDVIELPEGSWHLRPRKIIHTFWNKSGKPAKIIDIYLPGGFEEYLKQLCGMYKQYGKIEVSEVQKLIKVYDIEPHFELLQPLIEKYQLRF